METDSCKQKQTQPSKYNLFKCNEIGIIFFFSLHKNLLQLWIAFSDGIWPLFGAFKFCRATAKRNDNKKKDVDGLAAGLVRQLISAEQVSI